MFEQCTFYPYIRKLNSAYEERIRKIPFLNIDSVLIPSPYIKDNTLDIDYEHSFVWDEEGELLGYLLIYSNPEKTKFHLYKQVTSPFGRGKGIGSAFIEKLATSVAPDARIYLYVWEKLISSIDFFLGKGFDFEELTVYRKMKFHLMSARAEVLRKTIVLTKDKDYSAAEELGKVRHDAKKSLKVLFDMASMLSLDNFNKVIEDINRESTALLNTLNMHQDRIKVFHEVNMKELITERVIPFVEAAQIPCEVRLILGSKIPPVIGNYMDFSRALINLVSNSIDAIGESGRHGIIELALTVKGEHVILAINDNGVGIDAHMLEKGPDMVPLFVGKTTKHVKTGEGVGTRQIFSTFGANNISVASKKSEYTRWTILLKKSSQKETTLLTELESRYIGFIKATQHIGITRDSGRNDIAAFIWQLRQMEIYSYDLVSQFSRYNNIRDIYRNLLLYRYGGKNFDYVATELNKCRIDSESIKTWLLGITKRIKRNESYIYDKFNFDEFKGILFKSYGQAIECTTIFTLDPQSGRFHATDRKLAEHLDFVPYLGSDRDKLVRGEFSGDLKNITSPIYLGVWSIVDRKDMHEKIGFLRQAARQLLEMTLEKDKRLCFYNTTYNTCDCEIDTFKTTTLGEMAALGEEDYEQYSMASDEGLHGLVFAD
jgi:GNAT superfamily N-acetyltransferase